MATNTRRFIPRLQPLDERALPSVTYLLQGSLLFVTGDANANVITITDSGTATGVKVTGDGAAYEATTPITHVFVDTGDGDDTVVYNLSTSLLANRLVDARLGRGRDSFTANITGQSLATGVNLDISVYGAGGADALVLNAQGLNTNVGSILNVYFNGGAGKDKVTFYYSPGAVCDGSILLDKDQRQ